MLTPDFTAADLDFAKGDGLLPAVVQDAATRRVLMLAYLSARIIGLYPENG